MRSAKVTVQNNHGIHARVASALVTVAGTLSSKITVAKDGQVADGGSVLQLLMLDASKGAQVEVKAEGGDEETSLRKIEEFFTGGAGI